MNRLLRGAMLLCMGTVLLTVLSMGTAEAKGCEVCQSSFVPHSGGQSSKYLNGVAVVSANDIWAVGSFYSGGGGSIQTLIEHWNGTKWSIVPSPNPGSGIDILNSVAVASANNVWAVGNYGGASQTLIVHWNGKQWSVSPSPSSGIGLSGGPTRSLFGVAVVSANNAWSVGNFTDNNGIGHTLIEHWNGSQWRVVKSPDMGETRLKSSNR